MTLRPPVLPALVIVDSYHHGRQASPLASGQLVFCAVLVRGRGAPLRRAVHPCHHGRRAVLQLQRHA